jgi:hypothetical protein
MVDNDVFVREYLSPPEDSFWAWHEDGEVLAWRDGKTIAFREEVRTILKWLAPSGLPRFGAVALLLAATRHHWAADGSEAGMLASMLRSADQWPRQADVLQEVLAGLDKVHALDESLRVPVRSKAVLAEMMFDRAERQVTPEQALSIVEAMHRGMGELLARTDDVLVSHGYGPILLVLDLASLAPGLRRLDAEALRLRLATGLDSLPLPAELELAPSEAARALIESLESDPELSGLARIARRLVAFTSLPRSLSRVAEQDTGGYSDIANRGSPEQLLISELANDDLTLAVRVAMNEALYLRRETPPSQPHPHRAILIDAGIRSWGIPRVLATAVALAFTATSSKRGSVACYRARGDELDDVDLSNRDGVVRHLEALEPDLNFARAVPAFLKKIDDEAEVSEPILLLPEDALADAAVQQALRNMDLPQVFIATVNREGVFRLTQRRSRGVKALREVTLEIDELFDKPPALVDESLASNLPAILSVQPFPLLLSHQVENDRAWYLEGWGAFALTRDGRLMLWTKPGHGARQIAEGLPSRRLWWAAPADTEWHTYAVVGDAKTPILLRIERGGFVSERIPLQLRSAVSSISSHNGVLFGVHEKSVSVLCMRNGEVLQTLELSGDWQSVRGRFLRGLRDDSWHALSHDGRTARIERVAPTHKSAPFIAMFDRVGREGPSAVSCQGDLFCTASKSIRKVHHGLAGELAVPWISADGQRLRIHPFPPKPGFALRCALVNTHHLACTSCYADAIDDRVQKLVRPANLRHRFREAGLNRLGELVLCSHKGYRMSFTVRNGLPLFAHDDPCGELLHARPFEPVQGFDRVYKLSVATWTDGSQALLDSRGLLHLRFSDRAVREVTLVLAEGELTGWCADGRKWGKTYFIGEDTPAKQPVAAQLDIYESMIRPFARSIERCLS